MEKTLKRKSSTVTKKRKNKKLKTSRIEENNGILFLLPHEIIGKEIISYIKGVDLKLFRLTCKQIYYLINKYKRWVYIDDNDRPSNLKFFNPTLHGLTTTRSLVSFCEPNKIKRNVFIDTEGVKAISKFVGMDKITYFSYKSLITLCCPCCLILPNSLTHLNLVVQLKHSSLDFLLELKELKYLEITYSIADKIEQELIKPIKLGCLDKLETLLFKQYSYCYHNNNYHIVFEDGSLPTNLTDIYIDQCRSFQVTKLHSKVTNLTLCGPGVISSDTKNFTGLKSLTFKHNTFLGEDINYDDVIPNGLKSLTLESCQLNEKSLIRLDRKVESISHFVLNFSITKKLRIYDTVNILSISFANLKLINGVFFKNLVEIICDVDYHDERFTLPDSVKKLTMNGSFTNILDLLPKGKYSYLHIKGKTTHNIMYWAPKTVTHLVIENNGSAMERFDLEQIGPGVKHLELLNHTFWKERDEFSMLHGGIETININNKWKHKDVKLFYENISKELKENLIYLMVNGKIYDRNYLKEKFQ